MTLQGSDSATPPSITDTPQPSDSSTGGGFINETLNLGAAAAAAVGQKLSDTFANAPGLGSLGAEEQGVNPKQGYPQDAAPADAAVGGAAASIAPAAAAAASQQVRVASPARSFCLSISPFGLYEPSDPENPSMLVML